MEGGQPHFGPSGEILFRHNQGASTAYGSLGFIYRVFPDGSGLQKAVEQPVNQFNFSRPVSPDGRSYSAGGRSREMDPRPARCFARRKDAYQGRRPWTNRLGGWRRTAVVARGARGFLCAVGSWPDSAPYSAGRISLERRNRPRGRRAQNRGPARYAWSDPRCLCVLSRQHAAEPVPDSGSVARLSSIFLAATRTYRSHPRRKDIVAAVGLVSNNDAGAEPGERSHSIG